MQRAKALEQVARLEKETVRDMLLNDAMADKRAQKASEKDQRRKERERKKATESQEAGAKLEAMVAAKSNGAVRRKPVKKKPTSPTRGRTAAPGGGGGGGGGGGQWLTTWATDAIPEDDGRLPKDSRVTRAISPSRRSSPTAPGGRTTIRDRGTTALNAARSPKSRHGPGSGRGRHSATMPPRRRRHPATDADGPYSDTSDDDSGDGGGAPRRRQLM